MENKTFAQAIKTFFFPNESAAVVMAEMRKLTPQDKEDLKVEFSKIGINIVATQ
jgi:hypothetical protein